jgi:hypothetical protein
MLPYLPAGKSTSSAIKLNWIVGDSPPQVTAMSLFLTKWEFFLFNLSEEEHWLVHFVQHKQQSTQLYRDFCTKIYLLLCSAEILADATS